jgi:hypothetical protein
MSRPERERLDPLLARATRALRDEPPASVTDVSRVMERVRVRPRPTLVHTLSRPPRVARRHRPWWIAAGVAAAAIMLFIGGALRRGTVPAVRGPNDGLAPGEIATAMLAAPGAMREVRFTLDAPGASRVAVAGDFNRWQPVQLRRDEGSGHWVITLPIADGTYSYSFVVEGRRWVADPVAPAAPDDGFGAPSSVLIVESHDRKGST